MASSSVARAAARIDGASPWHLALDTPQAIQFLRGAIPACARFPCGRSIFMTARQSRRDSERSGSARLEIISARRDTLEVLRASDEP